MGDHTGELLNAVYFLSQGPKTVFILQMSICLSYKGGLNPRP